MWLADDDMSFATFDYTRFWSRLLQGFPHGPPLISQPTIRQSTQWRHHQVNHNQWLSPVFKNHAPSAAAFVAEATYVEQQVPLIDTQFWFWLTKWIEPLHAAQIKLSTPMGLDGVRCVVTTL